MELQDSLCSFCGKSNSDVKVLIAGPRVYICNYCVALCYELLVKQGVDMSVRAQPLGRSLEETRQREGEK